MMSVKQTRLSVLAVAAVLLASSTVARGYRAGQNPCHFNGAEKSCQPECQQSE